MEIQSPPKTGNAVLDTWLERLYEELMYVNGVIFSYTKSGSQTDIAIDQTVIITFDTKITDAGSHFANNTFTAPVGGLYLFNVNIQLYDLDTVAAYYEVILKTTLKEFYIRIDPSQFAADINCFPLALSDIVLMDAGDTAYITIFQSGGTQQTDIRYYSYFSGVLLGR